MNRQNVFRITTGILTVLCIFIFGVLFQLATGIVINDYVILIRVIIWLLNGLVAYTVAYFVVNIYRMEHKYFDIRVLFFSYLSSVIAIFSLGFQADDYSYVWAFGSLMGLISLYAFSLKIKDNRDIKKR